MIAQTVMVIGWDPKVDPRILAQHFSTGVVITPAYGISTSSSLDLDAVISNMAYATYSDPDQRPIVPLYRPPSIFAQGRAIYRQRKKMLPVRLTQRRNRNLHIQ